jgi:purine nucleosidase
LAWSPAHPVADAYRTFKPMPYDAPTTALAAMLHAVHPDGGYFKLSEPGTISVLDDGRTRFVPGPAGTHRYLIADPTQKDRIITLYAALVSATPVPRPVRGGRKNQVPPEKQKLPVPAADVKPP